MPVAEKRMAYECSHLFVNRGVPCTRKARVGWIEKCHHMRLTIAS